MRVESGFIYLRGSDLARLMIQGRPVDLAVFRDTFQWTPSTYGAGTMRGIRFAGLPADDYRCRDTPAARAWAGISPNYPAAPAAPAKPAPTPVDSQPPRLTDRPGWTGPMRAEERLTLVMDDMTGDDL